MVTKSGALIVADVNSRLVELSGNKFFLTTVRDISDRKEAEKLYRDLVELSPDMIVIHKEGKFLYINEAGVKMLGASGKEEIMGKYVWDFAPPRTKNKVQSQLEEFIQHKKKKKPKQLYNLHGRLLYVEMSAAPITYNGEPARQVIFRDVTERVHAEEEVRKSRDALKDIFDTVDATLYALDTQKNIYLVSSAVEELFDRPREKFENNPALWKERVHPEDRWIAEELDNELNNGRACSRIFRIVRPDGEIRWINDRGVPVFDRDGNVIGRNGLCVDVTKQKLTDEQLKESERRYRQLFELSPDAIMIHKEGKILLANPSAAKLLRANSTEELLHRPLLDFFDAENREFVFHRMEEAKKGRVMNPYFHKIKATDDEVRYIEAVTQLITYDDKEVLISMAKDITDRKKAEDRLKNAEKLASIGVMGAGVAHEINQPLNALKVNVDGMLYWLEKNRELDRDTIISELQDISEQGNRISGIVQYMRSLVSNEQELELRTYDLNQVLKEKLPFIEDYCFKNKIRLITEFEQLPPVVVDLKGIYRVITNLVENAVHALEETNIDNKMIFIRTKIDKDKVILEVSDNGPGINEKVKEKVFDPFFTTKEPGRGMGLGLALTRISIAAMGGEIYAQSNLGDGVTFMVGFPLIKSA
ncbi:PAS domain S-box protein [Metallumcola ferriviriculae]|uniref:histidine kinase n=1 Tax=Metallumcola ferriviriculae TaxID=3039180 RepID=A0AAU0UTS6_9FIRM|nr:PAS domain S-box protein [Desulfitibacteraceae bacterium MK1]